MIGYKDIHIKIPARMATDMAHDKLERGSKSWSDYFIELYQEREELKNNHAALIFDNAVARRKKKGD